MVHSLRGQRLRGFKCDLWLLATSCSYAPLKGAWDRTDMRAPTSRRCRLCVPVYCEIEVWANLRGNIADIHVGPVGLPGLV